jgi:hypothetical protein
MPEAEVTLRLALYLMGKGLSRGPIQLAIDGAHVKTDDQVHFEIAGFLDASTCKLIQCSTPKTWRGRYVHEPTGQEILIDSRTQRADLVADLRTGQRLRVECKKGPLRTSRGSKELPLLRGALGQILTVTAVAEGDLLAVAVPHSEKFADLAARWRTAPLVRQAGIRILTVERTGQVYGLVNGE